MRIDDEDFLVADLSANKEPRYAIELDFGDEKRYITSHDDAVLPDGHTYNEAVTNLFNNSETIENWYSSGVVVADNSELSLTTPHGPISLARVQETVSATNTAHRISKSLAHNGERTLTFSIFLKASERDVIEILMRGTLNDDNSVRQDFNLSTGQLADTDINGSTVSFIGATIEPDKSGGAYRVSLTVSLDDPAEGAVYVAVALATSSGGSFYPGDGVSGAYFGGAMLTPGADAGQYVRTTDTAPLTSTVAYPLLDKAPSGTSQKLIREEGRSEIGRINFSVIDKAEAISSLIREKELAGFGLREKTVAVYRSYKSLAWKGWDAGYVCMDTQMVDSLEFKNGIYYFKCSDVQRTMRKDIFTPVVTNITQTVYPGDAVVNVLSTAGIELFQHDAYYSDSPNEKVGYFRIGDTIIRFTGKTATSFTGCVHGVLNTKASTYELSAGTSAYKQPQVKGLVYLEGPGPQLALEILTGYKHNGAGEKLPDSWHLNIPAQYVASSSFTTIGEDLWDAVNTTGAVLRFVGEKKQDGKRFIERQICGATSTYLVALSDGALALRRRNAILDKAPYVATLDERTVVDVGALRHRMELVSNVYQINWNYDPIKDETTRTNPFIDLYSWDLHGLGSKKELTLRGLNGGSVTDEILLQRFRSLTDSYAHPPEEITVPCLSTVNRLEVGDVVRLKLDNVRDSARDGGTSIDRSMEIQRVVPNWETGLITFDLMGSTGAGSAMAVNSSSAVIPDSLYENGTDLSTFAGITISVVNGIGHITAGSLPAGDYYYIGDLTLDAGAILQIEGHVNLWVRGYCTFDGKVDGKGRGIGGSPAGVTSGYPGGVGMTRSEGGIDTVYPDFGSTSLDGLDWLPWIVPTESPTTFGSMPNGIPPLEVVFDGTKITGLPNNLKGSSGGAGSPIARNVNFVGGAGGASGAGLRIVSRGGAFGASGEIDVSGDDGLPGTVYNYLDPTFPEPLAVSGAGAGGSGGGVVWVIDGGYSAPDMTHVISEQGGSPYHAGAERLTLDGTRPGNFSSPPTHASYYTALDNASIAPRVVYIAGETQPQPDAPTVAGDVAVVNVSEYLDTPKTPSKDRTTLEISVVPPSPSVNWSHCFIYYRVQGATTWKPLGTTTPEVSMEVAADGTIYEFQARSVSFDNIENETGPETSFQTTLIQSAYTVNVPANLTVESGGEHLLLAGDGSVLSRLLVSWGAVPHLQTIYYEVEYKKSAELVWSAAQPTTETSVYISGVQDLALYDVRVRATTMVAQSDWVYVNNHSVIGKTSPPPDVTGFGVSTAGNTLTAKWDAVEVADLREYEIRQGGATWEDGVLILRTLSTEVPLAGVTNAGSYTWHIKALDRSTPPNYSVNAAKVTLVLIPPGVPVVSTSIEGSSYTVSWTKPSSSFEISGYEVRHGATWEDSTLVTVTPSLSFTGNVDWEGDRNFMVAALDSALNLGPYGEKSLTVSVPQAPQITFELIVAKVSLEWNEPVSSLPIMEYEIRYGDTFETGVLVTRISGNNYRVPINWTGDRKLHIAAIDINRNIGASAFVTVNIAAPSAPVVSGNIEGNQVTISWTTPASSIPINEYEVGYGEVVIGRVMGTVMQFPVDWAGSRVFWVHAIDINNNIGADGTADIVVSAPSTPTVSSQVVDNNVLLSWTKASGTLPISTYEIRKGATWETASVVGQISSEFATVFETTSATYTYWVAAIDTALNYGEPGFVQAMVNQPPDYILQTDYFTEFYGMLMNGVTDPVGIRRCFSNATELAYWTASANDTLTQSTDSETGMYSGLFTSTETNPNSSYETGCTNLTISSIFAGKTVRVRLRAKKPSSSAASEFAVAYSTNSVGNSGWQYFVPTTEWAWYEFTFPVPQTNSNEDYVGLWGDTSGAGLGVLIDRLTIHEDGAKANGIYLPVNPYQSYEDHFLDNSWTSPNDQITAGFTYYLQPGEASGSYAEVVDLGASLGGMKISLLQYGKALAGEVTITPTISVSNTSGSGPWTDYAQWEVYATNFRWVKYRIDVVGVDGAVYQLTSVNLKLDAKIKNDAGTVALSLGGAKQAGNLLDYTPWDSGVADPFGGWLRGTEAESVIVSGSGPGGITQPLWACKPSGDGSQDGGWSSQYYPATPTKAYLHVTFVKRLSTDGATYMAPVVDEPDGIVGLNGVPVANPYFIIGDLPATGTWYAIVGLMHEYDYGTTNTGLSGIYDLNGTLITTGTEFKTTSGVTKMSTRTWHGTNTVDVGIETQWMARPVLVETTTAEAAELIQKIINDATDWGGTLEFGIPFVDITSVTVTPSGLVPSIPVYDFLDIPNPRYASVYLFDMSGNKIGGSVGWAVKGY